MIRTDLGIRSRAPLRISFAGGGTELPEFIELHGGLIISTSINRYAYTTIRWNSNKSDCLFSIIARDVNRELEIENISCLEDIQSLNSPLPLHVEVLKYFVDHHRISVPQALRIETNCDAPEGSGLGSSSTLTVSMIIGFAKLFGIHLKSYEVARVAYEIERLRLGYSGGLQDHYSATFGGLNFIDFRTDGEVVVNPLRLTSEQRAEFESWLAMFYTGISRKSGEIIDSQVQVLKNSSTNALQNLLEIKKQALECKDFILSENYIALGLTIRKGWERKKLLSDKVSSPELDELYSLLLERGALGGKLSGAGGGGYFLIICEPDKKIALKDFLNQSGIEFNLENVTLTEDKALAWTIPT